MTADAPSADSLPSSLRESSEVADRQLPHGMLPGIASGLIAIGLFFGMGGPLWPDVLEAFDVSKSQFGLMTGIGLAMSLPVLLFGSRITRTFGNFTVLTTAVLVLAVSAVAIAVLEGGIAVLAAIILLRGLAIALCDLTANTLTMDAERILERHLMGPLHAMFSAGSIVGAGAVAIGLAAALSFRSLYAGLAVALVGLAVIFVLPMRSHDREIRSTEFDKPTHYRLAMSSPLIRLCGLLTALSFAGEVVIADWTALYLRDERGISSSFAAACIVAFAIAMLFGRLLNGSMIARFGVRHAIMVQGLIAVLGGAMIVTETSEWLAMAGCAIAGFGLAGIGPTALSVAGISLPDDPASAAGVTLAGGYVGLAITPVISGLVADGLSTRATLTFVMMLGALCILFARGMPDRLYDGS